MLRRSTFLALLSAAVLLAATSTSAKSVQEYRADIEASRIIVFEMLSEEATGAVRNAGAATETDRIKRIRELLPQLSRIETRWGTQDVSNGWLHNSLDHLITEDDHSRKLIVLSAIDERLTAILWKMSELDAAETAGATKDEEKQRLAEILTREQFQKPSAEQESRMQKWLREFLEWLRSFFPEPKEPAAAGESGMPNAAWWLQYLIIAIALGLIAFGIYRFGPALLPSLRREKRDKPGDRVILGERIRSEQAAGDILAEAERLAGEGDVRGAIRKGYIALLCELSDRKLIGLARYKTNRDYLRDVRKRREIYEGVRGLTNKFEAHWYGEKQSGREEWEKFRSDYREAVSKI